MWRLIRVFPGSEKRALEKIKEINKNIIEEVFIPAYDSANEIQPEIGGLIFVRTQKIDELKNICNMLKVFLDNNNIDNIAIENIKATANEKKKIVEAKFKENDEVQITSGNFPGLIGKILQVYEDEVSIVISIFGENQIISVSKEYIALVNN